MFYSSNAPKKVFFTDNRIYSWAGDHLTGRHLHRVALKIPLLKKVKWTRQHIHLIWMICDCDVWTGDTAACRVELSSRVSVRFDNSCLLLRPSFQDWTPLGNVVLIAQRKHFLQLLDWVFGVVIVLSSIKALSLPKAIADTVCTNTGNAQFLQMMGKCSCCCCAAGNCAVMTMIVPMNVEDVIFCCPVCVCVSLRVHPYCWCDPAALNTMYPVSKPMACGEIRLPARCYRLCDLNNSDKHYYSSLLSLSFFPSLFSIGFLSVWDPQCETLYGPWILVCPSIHSSIYSIVHPIIYVCLVILKSMYFLQEHICIYSTHKISHLFYL